MGLVNRVVAAGDALAAATPLADELCALPQAAQGSDCLSVYEQADLSVADVLANEFKRGMQVATTGKLAAGAAAFAKGVGRHGDRRRAPSAHVIDASTYSLRHVPH